MTPSLENIGKKSISEESYSNCLGAQKLSKYNSARKFEADSPRTELMCYQKKLRNLKIVGKNGKKNFSPIKEISEKNRAKLKRRRSNSLPPSMTMRLNCGKVKPGDFEWLLYLGKSNFSKIALSKKKSNSKLYAVKILRKKDLGREENYRGIFEDKEKFDITQNPFITKLQHKFEDEHNLYFSINYQSGGMLTHYIHKFGKFSPEVARFFSVEILLALETIHDILDEQYNDLNPDNILVDQTGHVKLTEFGNSKKILEGSDRVFGAVDYLAPEILLGDRNFGKVADFWSFGCLLYHMLVGKPPFSDGQIYKGKIYKGEKGNEKNCKGNLKDQIFKGEFVIPEDMDPVCASLVTQLLVTDPRRRLGANGIEEVKAHKFFEEINFLNFFSKKETPILRPEMEQFQPKFDKVSSTVMLKSSFVQSFVILKNPLRKIEKNKNKGKNESSLTQITENDWEEVRVACS